MTARLARLWAALEAEGIDLLFLPAWQSDLEWLTGLARRVPAYGAIAYAHHWVSGAFVAPGGDPVHVVTRHAVEFDPATAAADAEFVVAERDDAARAFRTAAARAGAGARRIAVGARSWARPVLELAAAFPAAELVTAEAVMGRVRRVKEPAEIEAIRSSARLVDEVFAAVSPLVRPGGVELDIAAEIDLAMRRAGAIGPSFDTAVWSMGPLSTRDASARLSARGLVSGSSVSFDFGAALGGYCSDFGRTIHLGDPDELFLRAYDAVIRAQEAGRRAAVPGARARDVHAAAVEVIAEAGLSAGFRHRTGHAIGLDVHEEPFLSEEDESILEPGIVVAIEPSVFLPGRVGARIEDLFVCAPGGAERLNAFPPDLVVA